MIIKAFFNRIFAKPDNNCLSANALTYFKTPALTPMADSCLSGAKALTDFEAPALTPTDGPAPG